MDKHKRMRPFRRYLWTRIMIDRTWFFQWYEC